MYSMNEIVSQQAERPKSILRGVNLTLESAWRLRTARDGACIDGISNVEKQQDPSTTPITCTLRVSRELEGFHHGYSKRSFKNTGGIIGKFLHNSWVRELGEVVYSILDRLRQY